MSHEDRRRKYDIVTARIGANLERGHVVRWLRQVAQARDDRADIEWAKALFEAADFIEGGEHIPAKVDRSPEGQDAEERLDRNDESAVPEGNLPNISKDNN